MRYNQLVIDQSIWDLGISWEIDNSVNKDKMERNLSGLRIVGAHDEWAVSIFLTQNGDDASMDVYIEDSFCNVPSSEWKRIVADAMIEHFQRLTLILNAKDSPFNTLFDMFENPLPN